MKIVILYCGSFVHAAQKMGAAIIVSQTTETVHEMMAKGRKAEFVKDSFPCNCFSNNSDFFYGLRLAHHDGTITLKGMFFDPQGQVHEVWFDKDAKVPNWPKGFFDATEEALTELL
jgi:hypothetical protein